MRAPPINSTDILHFGAPDVNLELSRGGEWAISPRNILALAVLFTCLAFLWSLLGLLAPAKAPAPEFPYAKLLAVEVGGHFLFGLVAGALSFDRKIAMLCGAEAVLIDSDHLFGAAGFPIQARLAHSLFFIATTAVIIGFFSRKTRSSGLISAAAISAILSHFSYDAFAGDGAFPLLFPFSFRFFNFPWISWIPFETLAAGFLFIAATWHRSHARI